MLFLLASCSEVKHLRLMNEELEKSNQQIRSERDQYKKAYYGVVEMREKERKESEAARERLERELRKLRADQAQQKELAEKKIAELQGSLDQEKDARKKTEDELRVNLQKAEADLAAARTEAQQFKTQNEAAQARLKEIEKSLADANLDRTQLKADLGAQTSRADQAGAEAAQLKKELEQARAQLAEAEGNLEKARQEITRISTQALKTPAPGGVSAPKSQSAPAPPSNSENQTQARAIAQELKQSLAQIEGFPGGKMVEVVNDTPVVRFSSDWLFKPQSILISDEATSALLEMARAAKRNPSRILRIEGHTDTQPIRVMPFPDNWGLASARADAAVRWLESEGKIPGRRLQSAGRGAFAPYVLQDTPEAMRLNRRVEIWFTAP